MEAVDLKNKFKNRFRFEHDFNKTWWVTKLDQKNLCEKREGGLHKYGKLFFEDGKGDEEGKIFCGFCLEKGADIDVEVGGCYKKENIMNGSWLWSDFMAKLETYHDKLISTIKKVVRNEKDYCLIIGVNFPNTECGIAFEFKIDDNLDLSGMEEEKESKKKEKKVEQEKIWAEYFDKELSKKMNISEIVPRIKSVPTYNWVCVDFYIRTYVSKNLENDDIESLWKNHLEPWKPWLRKSE